MGFQVFEGSGCGIIRRPSNEMHSSGSYAAGFFRKCGHRGPMPWWPFFPEESDQPAAFRAMSEVAGYERLYPTDKGYLLPSEKAVGNKLKPGCAEPAIVGGFKQLETQYVPVWKSAN